MTAMIDARCTKCGKRFGWCGTMSNMPACPRCGYRPPQEELDKDEAEMEAMRQMLLTHPRDGDATIRRKQRVAAGLTLRQAAEQLGITAVELSRYERGIGTPPAELLERMGQVYDVG